MKKSNVHLIVLAVLVLVSLCSYAYLATRNTPHPDNARMEAPENSRFEEDQTTADKSGKYLLLDIEAIKRLASAARRLLPASSF